jgi:tryptophan-rich sensory protein
VDWLRAVTSSLPGNILLLWAVLLLVNLPTPLLGLNFDDESPQLWYQPPGWVIPLAWFVLFALLGTARWRLLLLDHIAASGAAALVVWLAVWCAAYAYYTPASLR